MAQNQWRLNRLRAIETALMDQLLLGAEPGASPEDRMAKAMIDRGGDPLDKIERYAAAAERAYFRARRELTTYRKVQNELDLQARQIADHEHMLRRRAENEERFLGIPNPYKSSEPSAVLQPIGQAEYDPEPCGPLPQACNSRMAGPNRPLLEEYPANDHALL